ncbi:MAG: aspartate ammonia-lyase [Armatimonadota bacterium]
MAEETVKMRIERDSIGEEQVPADAYYGLHTSRSLRIFQVSGLKAHPLLVDAYMMIKMAAAQVNAELGLLNKDVADAIAKAAQEVLDGKLRDQFLVDVFQMGAGTSFNMNCNEVLANRALELLGASKGEYSRVNPNDHVNMSQSTNDTFPTAMRISGRKALAQLIPQVELLADAFYERAQAFDSIVKAGRTHLQDAVPIRLGQEFAAYGATMRKCAKRLSTAAESLEELGIGGTAAGTGLNAHPEYPARMVKRLSELAGFQFRLAPDLREAMQSHLPIEEASSALRLLALELIRIANDLRLLSSGPTTGFAEIMLPPLQPGSSIMPGKVNPSVPEMLNMVCFQVVGNDLTISMAGQAGQLELNVMMPVMAHNLLMSSQILENGVRIFRELCVKGIKADEERCRRYAESTMALATALNPYIGYARAAEVAKEALATRRTIREVVVEKGLLSPEKAAEVLDPMPMTEPGIRKVS